MSCDIWTKYVGPDGYGRWWKAGAASTLAHRVAWEIVNGPVPEGHELHHTCGETLCVNVDHLHLVTRSEHQRIHRRKSHCKHGHAMTPSNTYVRPTGSYDCRECIRGRAKRYQQRKAAA